MPRFAAKLAVACLAALALDACAPTEEIVPVGYTPTATARPVTPEGKAFRLQVADDRGIYRYAIGARIGAYGQETTAIRPSVPVRDIVENAMVEELKRRGISIDDTLARTIDVSITAMHNNFTAGFFSSSARGIVAMTVVVTDGAGASGFDKAYSESHEPVEVFLSPGEVAARAVGGALAKTMNALFADPAFLAALAGA